jgi:hypothetical protein
MRTQTLCHRIEKKNTHYLEISKYKLWKTIHELGFRYKKLSGNRKCLVERTDIVDQRIIYLRAIKKKRGLVHLKKGFPHFDSASK